MSYRADTIDILRSVVEAMRFPVTIKSVVEDSSGTFTLTVCDLYHAQPTFSVEIDGNSYTIVSVEHPGTLVLTGTAPITADSFELYRPYFYHGTPIATGEELKQEDNAFDKTPMVWALEQFEDVFHRDPDDPVDRETTIRLFFLTQGDNELWTTADAYANAIKPMRRLQECFSDALAADTARFSYVPAEETVKNYAKFGVYIQDKGSTRRLFADQLAGCEMPLSPLVIMKSGICPTEC